MSGLKSWRAALQPQSAVDRQNSRLPLKSMASMTNALRVQTPPVMHLKAVQCVTQCIARQCVKAHRT